MTEAEIEELFADIEPETGTRLLAVSHLLFAAKPARMELWSWDGITGHSVVFCLSHVAALKDEGLVNIVRRELPSAGEAEMTVKPTERHVFVNHSFSID